MDLGPSSSYGHTKQTRKRMANKDHSRAQRAAEAIGVNVFGYDGFRDDSAIGVAVDKLFAKALGNARRRNRKECSRKPDWSL